MTCCTCLLSFLELLTVFVDDRRDVLEITHLDEVFRRRQRDWFSREAHRVQPVLDVLDLSGAEHQPLLSIRKSTYKMSQKTRLVREREDTSGVSRTEIEFHPALPGRKRMIRVHDGVVRDESFQCANFMKITISQSATPEIIAEMVNFFRIFRGNERVPFVKDIGEPVIPMNGGIAFERGII